MKKKYRTVTSNTDVVIFNHIKNLLNYYHYLFLSNCMQDYVISKKKKKNQKITLDLYVRKTFNLAQYINHGIIIISILLI
jgi:hypothetical protein